MDLSTFQLVDAINDMDMLRNLSEQQQQGGGQQYSHLHHQQQQQHQHQQQQQQQRHQQHQQQRQHTHTNNAYNQLHGDIDMLFQSDHTSSSPHMNAYLPPSSAYKANPATTSVNSHSNQIMSSPHYRTTSQQLQQNDCFDQEDILTPLISPAMTPSFSYQVQQQKHHPSMNFDNGSNDMDFSPLSSPAILPQMDRHNRNQHNRTSYQDQLTASISPNSTMGKRPNEDSFENLSANQIAEQYEQLEQAKQLITQKLSELQKSQPHHNQYDDQGYQRSTLSSDSSISSSKDSLSSSLSKTTNGISTMRMSGDHTSIHHHHVLSKPNSPSQSPHMEPATPASLMNMKISSSSSSKLQFSSSGRTQQQQYYNGSSSNFNSSAATVPTLSDSNQAFQSPVMNTNPMQDNNMVISPMMTPTNTTPHHPTPPSPLSLHSRGSKTRSSSSLKEKSTTASSRLSKKQRRESTEAKSSTNIHASPRALKPLLISPTLNPGLKPLPSSIVPPRAAVHSVEDAERILATRSNYQNLMEGKGAALGIAFSTQIKSGLEVRRTAHKAAEQKRRDSLKEWFDRLRREVEDGYVKRQKTLMSQVIKAQELEKNSNGKQKSAVTTDEETDDNPNSSAAAASVDASAMKPLSKVLLLQYAYEYIASLKNTLKEKDETIDKLLSNEAGGEANHLKRKEITKENEESKTTPSNDTDEVTEESDEDEEMTSGI